MRHYLPLNMVIAVYVDFRFYKASDVDRYFINGLLNKLAAALTGHKIHLITPVTEHGLNDSPLSIIPLNVKAGVVYRFKGDETNLKRKGPRTKAPFTSHHPLPPKRSFIVSFKKVKGE